MGVRVKIRIESINGRSIEASCLANAGYESEEPELMIPIAIADKLGFWPKMEKFSIEEYKTAGGVTKVYKISKAAKVKVICPDKQSDLVLVDVAISEHEDEVLMNDQLISALKIVLEDPGKGLWRFKDDPSDKLRKSEKLQIWRSNSKIYLDH